MFKKHELRIQVAKKSPSNDPAPQPVPTLTPEEINNLAKEQIKNIAVGVGAVLIAGFLAAGTKEVAVHTAKTKIK